MELTRRDALAALAAAGSTGSALAASRAEVGRELSLGEGTAETLVSLAEVLYPTAASAVPSFVETYVVGRTHDRPAYRSGTIEAVDVLDSHAVERFGRRFADLPRGERAALLDDLDVGVAEPDPAGADLERVRYYLVNELLFAFYASPAGGRLVGIENPPGHPGGIESYRRGPADDESEPGVGVGGNGRGGGRDGG